MLDENHESKAMGRVIYGSGKTAFFEEKKANFAARLNWTTHHFDAAANWIEGEFSFNLTANGQAEQPSPAHKEAGRRSRPQAGGLSDQKTPAPFSHWGLLIK